jgi:hypothetical protein
MWWRYYVLVYENGTMRPVGTKNVGGNKGK